MPPLQLRDLTINDLPAIVKVHRMAFPQAALTQLGSEAVRRYYEWQLTGPHQVVAAGAFVGDQMVGFLIGGEFRGAVGGFIRKNRNYLFLRVITRPWLIGSPLFRSRFSVVLGALGRRKPPVITPSAPAAPGRSFAVLAIAVDPQQQGHGVGKRLMLHAEEQAMRQDFQRMHLTVNEENHSAIGFYQRLGWTPVEDGSQGSGSRKMQKVL